MLNAQCIFTTMDTLDPKEQARETHIAPQSREMERDITLRLTVHLINVAHRGNKTFTKTNMVY